MQLTEFIKSSLAEDIGSGDHTSLACIPESEKGNAKLLVKDQGILAGVELAELIFKTADPQISFNSLKKDGDAINFHDIAFTVHGSVQTLLKTERLVLNCMQRMSGIASLTRAYVDKLKGLHTKVLDTRKTTPLMRELEKWAVRIGGGVNHRMGLYDMILLKDNHIDFCGGIETAIIKSKEYLTNTGLHLPIEIEARSLDDVIAIMKIGGVDRIMLDNFSIEELKRAIDLINKNYETEASGGITLETVRSYAETGVDYVSVGALTHSVRSLDLSLKAL